MILDDLEPFKEATPPSAIMDSGLIWIYLLVSVLLLAVILAAFIRIILQTATRHHMEVIMAPFERASLQLKKLHDKAPGTRTAAIESSLIFRELLKEETGDPSLFETHEEFAVRPDALNSLPVSMREETRHYLHKLARLKYVPGDSKEEALPLVEDAQKLVQKLMIKVKEEETHRKHSSRNPKRPGRR